MKRLPMIRFAMLALLLPGARADAQVRDSIISASAHRTWTLPPDRAVVHVSVADSGATAAQAITKLQAHVPDVVAALSRLRVRLEPPVMLTTTQERDYNARAGTPLPYIARSSIKAHVESLDSLPHFFSAVFEAGASIGSITFQSSSADSIRQARLPIVIAAAKAEAATIALAFGGRLGALIDVSVTGGAGHVRSPTISTSSMQFVGIAAPQVEAPSGVTVRYQLLP